MDTLVVKPVRHGVDNVLVTNCWFDDDEVRSAAVKSIKIQRY